MTCRKRQLGSVHLPAKNAEQAGILAAWDKSWDNLHASPCWHWPRRNALHMTMRPRSCRNWHDSPRAHAPVATKNVHGCWLRASVGAAGATPEVVIAERGRLRRALAPLCLLRANARAITLPAAICLRACCNAIGSAGAWSTGASLASSPLLLLVAGVALSNAVLRCVSTKLRPSDDRAYSVPLAGVYSSAEWLAARPRPRPRPRVPRGAPRPPRPLRPPWAPRETRPRNGGGGRVQARRWRCSRSSSCQRCSCSRDDSESSLSRRTRRSSISPCLVCPRLAPTCAWPFLSFF